LVHNRPVGNEVGQVGDVGTWYQLGKTRVDGTEINHIPPHSTKPAGSSHSQGGSIRMDYADHRALLSTQNTLEGIRHRMMQRDLIANGYDDLANELEYDDMRRVAPGKYDDAIELHKQTFLPCE
jgi:hypothetical protein